ncbi:uncharacterized protein LOC123829210 [Phyllostomus hastatus]|uniref:uncharacterized protein LOC123829210 n=1 Tax=Phyllostomus hastatus TaxID=9423 RepID=UPI001E684F6B|nr:uncharacterized protein LOC123829210 [Phyllostomus hastatus]
MVSHAAARCPTGRPGRGRACTNQDSSSRNPQTRVQKQRDFSRRYTQVPGAAQPGGRHMALPSAPLSLSLLLLPLPLPPLLAKQTGTAPAHRTFQRSPVRPGPTDSSGPHEYWSPGHCCLLCPAGEHVREPCSRPHTRGQCDKCDPGTFTAFPNGLGSCLLCGTCSQDQDEAAECTATSNTRCQCRPGRFYKAPGDEEFCTRCSVPEGTVVLQQCNSTADTVCGPPGPEGRRRLWLVGSFMILSAVLLGITISTACTKKPKDGGFQPVCSRPSSSACSELESLEERPRDGGESLGPESPVCCGPSHGTREADPPGPTTGDHSRSAGSLDLASPEPRTPR